jgi:Ca2+-binding EF-hand superfamily protein
MKTTMKLAFAIATFAVLNGQALAQSKFAGPNDAAGFRLPPLELADIDKSGDVTFDEFKKAAGDRFANSDANKDGKVTFEEMAAVIEKIRTEQIAKRMINRFDVDGDGAVTLAEMETNQQEIYARLDRNNDGKLVKEEMQRRVKGSKAPKG